MVYVQIVFQPFDARSYTYSYDGDAPLAVGDRVEVETKRGPAEVEVVGVIAHRPASIPAHVEIKPISRVILAGGEA